MDFPLMRILFAKVLNTVQPRKLFCNYILIEACCSRQITSHYTPAVGISPGKDDYQHITHPAQSQV
jgi:hypothetical protein